jgi:uncharacterized lipoprotein YddW (UPF0748 family)
VTRFSPGNPTWVEFSGQPLRDNARSWFRSAFREVWTPSAITLLLTGLACAQERPLPTPPEPEREFRGVWVATVANINWPSKPGLTVTAQKAELLALLDTAQDNNLNAVLFQVRPACDALYQSDLEPWSESLTGTMGRAPSPAYDPLEFAASAAHRRGLEFHAWFNPFRARHHTAQSPVSANHISKLRPGLVYRYGGYLWLDPGEPAAREHSLKVILDVVRRYDIDGVHFDDYFYPYPEKDSRGGTVPFPDRATWEKQGAGLSRSDWRRRNVDTFIRQVEKAVHEVKPWVRFGISPFGIWRPGYPKPVTGLDAYDSLYADARKWLQSGWVDYLVPQLYWSIDAPGQSFPVLLEWWEEQNVRNRHLWIGLNTGKVGEQWPADEVFNQIKLTRQFGLEGHVHYNIGEFVANPTFAKGLRTGCYPEPALPPASPWLDSTPPSKPRLDLIEGTTWRATWTPGPGEAAWQWLLQTRTGERWKTILLPGATSEQALTSPPEAVALRAVDRCGNLSLPTVEVLQRD